MSLKQKFQSEVALQAYIDTHAEEYTREIREALGAQEHAFVRKLRDRKLGAYLLILGVVGLPLSPIVFSFLLSGILGYTLSIAVGIIFCISIAVQGWRMISDPTFIIANFNNALNTLLIARVFEIFGVEGTRVALHYEKKKVPIPLAPKHSANALVSAELEEVKTLLDVSELITEPRNRLTIDDIYKAHVDGKVLRVAELDVRHVTGSGKHRRVKHIFKGYFVSFALDVRMEGKTFVSTEGDTNGFGYQNFFSFLSAKDIQPTHLEWNAFEELLHVATNNPVEARYLLPPDFMHDLYEWWQSKKQHIRISFIGGTMYILFPDGRVRLRETISHITTEEVAKHISTIALPLLHVFHLAEDVHAQFNHKNN